VSNESLAGGIELDRGRATRRAATDRSYLPENSRMIFTRAILMLTSNQQTGNDTLDIGLNALDTTTKGKHKSDLSLSAFAKRLGKTGAYLTLVTQGAIIYRKLLTQVNNFEADYRKACADKLMSPTHLREMDVPDNALALIYRLTKEQKWTKEQTKSASDRVRTVAKISGKAKELADLKKSIPELDQRIEKERMKQTVKEAPVLAESRRPTKQEQANKGDVGTVTRGSNSSTYLAARLKRDAPEIAKRLERGEFKSVRAAAIQAGIIQVTTRLEKAIKAYLLLNTAQFKEIKMIPLNAQQTVSPMFIK
jgi:hypothetical protein